MTAGKTAWLTAGAIGVIALAVVAAPKVRDSWSTMNTPAATTATPAVESDKAPVAKTVRTNRATPSAPRASEAAAPKTNGPLATVAVSAWDPELRDRVKKVLSPGAKPEIAAAEFENAEQFMTVAHAARNTQVPFMVLKHHVLTQKQSLADAIHEYKPELDAKAEVKRAQEAARSDLAS
jgi:hypothetical protein